jgi:hypothetical protein
MLGELLAMVIEALFVTLDRRTGGKLGRLALFLLALVVIMLL